LVSINHIHANNVSNYKQPTNSRWEGGIPVTQKGGSKINNKVTMNNNKASSKSSANNWFSNRAIMSNK
jgi:hypothetical protein